ncbi:MAG: DUF2844 domain-containing protein [Candidatus Saccharibacteria bacterium]|nr:DUF2844 domain-containing protein [Rhodoferax sp.]
MRMLLGNVAFLMTLMVATDGLAALGQAPFSTAVASAPKPRLLAPNNTPVAAYTVHEAQLETGTVVREYASASGQVFAVTWRGPVLPDLNQWLGGYFGAFKQGADQLRLSGRRGAPINLVQEGLVVQSNGRMRNFFGHAYVPALVPPSLEINDVLQ